MKTYIPKQDDIERRWLHYDADGQVLGRLATRIARTLRGKDKPLFTPHMDTGDFVVVTNAEKVRLTGTKEDKKTYFRYSGYPGGAKTTTVRRLRQQKPEEIVRHAVWGMLPKNRLGRKLMRKLRVYAGTEHPHAAQQPQSVVIE